MPFGDIAALNAALDEKTAAVILEPIQGEGGVRIPGDEYFASVALLCKQRGVLLIIDEIQTGFCRTGKFFAIEHSQASIAPDIMTMGKGIAGGFPFAAFAVSASVDKQLSKGDHGGTFCGNPLACAVATAVVNYLRDENMADKTAKSGEIMIDGLRKLRKKYPSLIGPIRGKGLLCAFELDSDNLVTKVTEAALRRGLLITPTRNRVIRLIPALIVTQAEIARGLELLDCALASVVPKH